MSRRTVLFEITRDCDRACVYCYNRDRRPPQPGELSPARLEALLDRLCATERPADVTIIGGEPLTVTELEDTVRRFADRGWRVALSTNGLGLGHERTERLVQAGVAAFEVSLDGPNPATHAALTGAGGHHRVRQVLADLTLAGLPVTVGAMLTQANRGEIDELLHLCFALGVPRVVLNQLAPVGCAGERIEALALSDDELREVLAVAQERSAELGLRIGVGLPVEPCRIDRSAFPHLEFEACCCGQDKWVLEPNGAVRTCELASTVVGNLHVSSLSELALTEAVRRFRQSNLCSACDGCTHWLVCRGGCRFMGRASTSAAR